MLDGFICDRCGHAWCPRTNTKGKKLKALTCHKCRSPFWDTP